MPKSIITSTGSQSVTATYKFLPFGSGNIKTTIANTDEVYSSVTIKENLTISDLYFRVTANTRDAGTAYCALRKNGVDTALICNVPFGTTGWFSDTTSRISIATDDTCNFIINYGSGGTGSLTFDTFMAVVDTTSHTLTSYFSNIQTGDYTGSTYTSITGSNYNLTTEAPTKTLFPRGVLKNHNLYTTNSRNGDSFAYVRRNSTSNIPLTLTNNTPGYYSNFTDTVSVADNDTVDYYVVRGGTTGTLSIKSHNLCFSSPCYQFPMIADTTNALTITTSSVFYLSPSGNSHLNTTSDTSSQIFIPISGLKVSQFKVNVQTNTVNDTTPIYLRKNGVDTGVTITIPSATTGTFYNDTSSQIYNKNDTFNIRVASNGTTGSLGINTTTIVWENIQSTAAWYNELWTCRSEIEIDSAYVDEAVPVIPLFLSYLDNNFWTNVNSDGSDIRITQSDGTGLRDYYLINFDSVNKKGCIIVNVDGYIDTTSNVKLIVYCGNSDSTSSVSTKDTFIGTGYVGVYFPGESLVDAVSTRDLTAANAPGTAAVSALEFDAATLNGTDQYYGYDGTPAITTPPFTVETIGLLDSLAAQRICASITASSGTNNIISQGFRISPATRHRVLLVGNSSGLSVAAASASPTVSTWHMITSSRSGTTSGTTTQYMDGANAGTESTTLASYSTMTKTTIGAIRDATTSSYWDGNIAYVGLSSSARSANYIATMYDAWFTSAFRLYGSSQKLEDWYDINWTKRGKITIDSTYVDEAVPVIPITLSGLDLSWWDNVKTDGSDIRITQSDGLTLRDYYIVKIDTVNKIGLLLVNVDGYISISTNIDLYVYCGNSSASAVSTTNTFNGSGYKHLWFPGESTNDIIGNADLTGVNTPGTAAESAYNINASTYNGSTQYHHTGGAFDVTSWPLSIEAIGYSSSSTANQALLSFHSTSGTSNIMLLRLRGDLASPTTDPTEMYTSGFGGGTSDIFTSAGYTTNTYVHMLGTRELSGTDTTYLWLNGGNQVSTTISMNAWNSLTRASFGAFNPTSILNYLNGRIIFGAISNVKRSINYASTMNNAWKTSAFRTYSATEDISVGSGSQNMFKYYSGFFTLIGF